MIRADNVSPHTVMDQQADKEFVEYIIKNIVNHPDDVVVIRKTDEMGVLLEVKVHQEDMGLLIGRAGTTAKAIRVLARIIGMRNNARVNLRILEPEGSTRVPRASDAGQTPQVHQKQALTDDGAPANPGITKDIEDVVKDLQM